MLLLFCVIKLAYPAFAAGTGAQGDWWMFRHDPQHTGRSPYDGPSIPWLQWSSSFGTVCSSPAIGADGTIYVGSMSQYYSQLNCLNAINPTDGSVKWKFPTGGYVISSPAIGTDGTIYVGSNDANLYALTDNGTSYALKWKYATGLPIMSSPVIGADGTIYVGSTDKNLYALTDNGATCTLKWKFTTGSWVSSSPALGADGTIYFGAAGFLYALTDTGASGTLKWKSGTEGQTVSSPAIGTDGTIYVGSNSGGLYAFNSVDGSQLWAYYTYGNIVSSPAIGADGTIFIGSTDTNIYALAPEDGALQWQFTTGGAIFSSPTLGADGTLYITSQDGDLYVLDSANGALKSSNTLWTTTPAVVSNYDSSPAIGANGTLYVGTHSFGLYAFTQPPPLPVLSLVQSCSVVSALPGQTVSYTLTCANNGSQALGTTLSDVLPAGVSYVRNSAGGKATYNATTNTLTWSLGNLTTGGSINLSFQATVNATATAGTVISNSAVLTSAKVSTPIHSNTVTFVVTAAKRGDWWMYQHDAQHTGRSACAGPTVPWLKWQFATGYQVNAAPVVGADGTIYVSSADDSLYAFNPSDGSLKWQFATQDQINACPALGTDGTVYTSSFDGNLYALNPLHGGHAWQVTTGCDWHSSPTVGVDGTVYLGTQSGYLAACAANGTVKWSFALAAGSWIDASPAIGTDGTIFVGASDGLYALNPADGSLKWKSATGSACASPVVGTDGTVYVVAADGYLYAFNPATGTQKWTIWVEPLSCPAIGADGTLYCCRLDGYYIAAIDPVTGTVSTSHAFGGSKMVTAPLIDANGIVYVGASDHKLYAFNSADLSLKWSYALPGTIASSLSIDATGTIYVGSTDGNLYAIAQAPPALSALALTSAPAVSTTTGTPVTLTATPSNGGNVQYQFWLYNQNASPAWRLLQAYSSSATCTWTPSSTGQYLFSVTAQDGASSTTINQLLWFTVTQLTVSVSASPVAPQTIGTPITLTASAPGAQKPSYQFWAYNPNVTPAWSQLQAYSSSAVCAWRPSVAGNYLLAISARDGVSGTVVNTQIWYQVTGPALTAVSFTTSSASPQLVYTPITLTAAATGGTGIQYQFWVCNPYATPAWSQLQAYSSSAACTWVPTTPGNYLLSVSACDSVSGTEVNQTSWFTVDIDVSLTVSASPAAPQPPNTAISLIANVGGSSNSACQFWLYNPATSVWNKLQGYDSGSPVCIWTPTAAGNYLISVTTMDYTSGTEVNQSFWYTVE